MNKQELLHQIRTKKIGALIYDARIASTRSMKECAEAMGVSRYQYKAYESGEQAPTLPELELLSFYLNIPMEHFWGKEALSEKAEEEGISEKVKDFLADRNQEIIAALRQARDDAELTLEELAERTSIDKSDIGDYELGEQDIPLPDLERMAAALNINLNQLLDQNGIICTWRSEQEAIDTFLDLPEELRSFVSKPVNRSYLELAMRLSSLDVEKLRAVAEGLLEITF